MTDVSFDSDDFLAHHGVLGMHWGERNAETVAKEGPGGAPAKKTGKQKDAEILAARKRQGERLGKLNMKAALTYTQTTQKGAEAANKAYEKYEKHIMENPDAATAQRMTRGEKATTGVAFGLLGIGTIAYAALLVKH